MSKYVFFWVILFIFVDKGVGTATIGEEIDENISINYPDFFSYLRILHIDDYFMLLGGKNEYFNISTITFKLNQHFHWKADKSDTRICKGDCNSYILSAVKQSPTSFLICASSAQQGRCRHHERNLNLGLWRLHTGNLPEVIPWPMISIFQWQEHISFHDSIGTEYTLGHHRKNLAKWCPNLFRNHYKLANGSRIDGLRSSCDENKPPFRVDYVANRVVKFRNIFETPEHIYFTFVEPATEAWHPGENIQTAYSRIARVCKNDRGIGTAFGDDGHHFQFSTLFKARLICGKAAKSYIAKTEAIFKEFDGYYAFHIDEIAAATSPHFSSIIGTEGEQIILTVFNSGKGGVGNTTAICAFRMADISDVFETERKLIDVYVLDIPRVYDAKRPPAKCYDENEKITDKALLGKYLFYKPIKSLGNTTLYISNDNYRVTGMHVDWQIPGADGEMYDVIFLSTDNGLIVKLLYFAENNEPPRYHVIQQLQVFQGDHIRDLRMIRDDKRDRYILANTRTKLKKVAVVQCEGHVNCSECKWEGRPYCRWNYTMQQCLEFDPSDKDAVDDPCEWPTTTTQPTTTTTEEATTTTTEDATEKSTTTLPETTTTSEPTETTTESSTSEDTTTAGETTTEEVTTTTTETVTTETYTTTFQTDISSLETTECIPGPKVGASANKQPNAVSIPVTAGVAALAMTVGAVLSAYFTKLTISEKRDAKNTDQPGVQPSPFLDQEEKTLFQNGAEAQPNPNDQITISNKPNEKPLQDSAVQPLNSSPDTKADSTLQEIASEPTTLHKRRKSKYSAESQKHSRISEQSSRKFSHNKVSRKSRKSSLSASSSRLHAPKHSATSAENAQNEIFFNTTKFLEK